MNPPSSLLFSPARLGPLTLANRIAMAPMTRSRATADGTPTPLMAEYYAQRASAGLIVTEGVSISAQGQGFLNVPGIFTDAHEAAWRPIVQRVHDAGSRVFMQLWHVGRIAHPDNMQAGEFPVAPSALAFDRTVVTPTGLQPPPVPRELSDEGVRAVIADYARAARRAVDAGCDGVEIHAANGYLPGQFLHQSSNLRSDGWGGSIGGRARFLVETARACCEAVGADRVGVRLSPFSVFNGASSTDDAALHDHLLRELAPLGLIYLHVVTAEVAGNQTVVREGGADRPDVVGFTRERWPHGLIAAGGFDRDSAERELAAGRADVIAFGRDFIGNPDLPERLRHGHPLVPRQPADWYGAGAEGYTDYPLWTAERAGLANDTHKEAP